MEGKKYLVEKNETACEATSQAVLMVEMRES